MQTQTYDPVHNPPLSDEVETSDIQPKANEQEEAYHIVNYKGYNLPTSFQGFVFARWMRSLWQGNDLYKLIDRTAFFHHYHRYIEAILSRPQTTVRFALLSSDPDNILGFLVHRDNILDYVLVDQFQRRNRIATTLIPPGIDTITHITHLGLKLWLKKDKWKFNPFV